MLRLATDFVNLPADETEKGIRMLLEVVGEFTHADCCGVSRLDRGNSHLQDIYTWECPGVPLREGAVSGIDVTGMEALFGDAEQPTLVADVTTDPRVPEGFGDAFAAFGVRSMAWVPVSADDHEIVALGITNRHPTEWDADPIALLGAAARMVANLRERARTTADLEEKTLLLDELSQSIDHHFFMFATDPPRILYSNQAVESISGESSTDFDEDPGSLLRVALPEYRAPLIGLFSHPEGPRRELEYPIQHVDGSIRWLRTQVFPGKPRHRRQRIVRENETEAEKLLASDQQPGRHGPWLAVLTEDITQRVRLDRKDARLKEFERMLSWISGRFVEARLGAMDSVLCEVVATISSFLGVERSHLYLLDHNRDGMAELVRWYEEAHARGSDELRFVPLHSLPYFADEVVSGRTVAVPNTGELPAPAAAEREFLKSHGIRSIILIPLTTANGIVGTLAFTTLSHEQTWSTEDASMLRVFGDIVASAVARRESDRRQQESLDFDRLITSLVSEFMNLPAGELDSGFARALETIAKFVDGDRSTIFILDENKDSAELFRGWWAPGSEPIVTGHAQVETSPGSPYGDWVRSEEPHLVIDPDTVESYHPSAAREMRKLRVGSVVSLPIDIEGHRIGWFSIGAKPPRVSWNKTEIRSLGIAADALANMYSRHRNEDDRRRHKVFDDALAKFATDFIKRPISEIRAGIAEIVDAFGRFAGCDRAAILLLDQPRETASTYHEWVGRGDSALVDRFPLAEAPWFYAQLVNAPGPWIMHRDEFPASDEHAAIALDVIGIRTLLNCPIADGTHLFGYASIGYSRHHHRPAAGTEQVLAMAAGIISNALARERVEHHSIEQRDALARALRLGSMGQLATGIAHELNQPLTAIANYSRACVRRLAVPGTGAEGIPEILERISDEALRAGDIVHKLRNHVKGGPPVQQTIPIDHLVDHACTLLAGTARQHRVEIVVEHGAELANVAVETSEIEQVVINLVQNSIDSIAAADSEHREVHIATRRNRAFVEVDVSDSGPGVSEQEADKLFDQFHTTKPGGLGLGLSISRYLIESNGGSIEADLGADGGTTFRFALPLARPRRRVATAPSGHP